MNPQQTAREPNIERRLLLFALAHFAAGWVLAGCLEWAGAAVWVCALVLLVAVLAIAAGVGPVRRRLWRTSK